MTEQEENDLLTQGQQLADQQMLETLLALNPIDRQYFEMVRAIYPEMPLDEFVQYWRETYDR